MPARSAVPDMANEASSGSDVNALMNPCLCGPVQAVMRAEVFLVTEITVICSTPRVLRTTPRRLTPKTAFWCPSSSLALGYPLSSSPCMTHRTTTWHRRTHLQGTIHHSSPNRRGFWPLSVYPHCQFPFTGPVEVGQHCTLEGPQEWQLNRFPAPSRIVPLASSGL